MFSKNVVTLKKSAAATNWPRQFEAELLCHVDVSSERVQYLTKEQSLVCASGNTQPRRINNSDSH